MTEGRIQADDGSAVARVLDLAGKIIWKWVSREELGAGYFRAVRQWGLISLGFIVAQVHMPVLVFACCGMGQLMNPSMFVTMLFLMQFPMALILLIWVVVFLTLVLPWGIIIFNFPCTGHLVFGSDYTSRYRTSIESLGGNASLWEAQVQAGNLYYALLGSYFALWLYACLAFNLAFWAWLFPWANGAIHRGCRRHARMRREKAGGFANSMRRFPAMTLWGAGFLTCAALRGLLTLNQCVCFFFLLWMFLGAMFSFAHIY